LTHPIAIDLCNERSTVLLDAQLVLFHIERIRDGFASIPLSTHRSDPLLPGRTKLFGETKIIDCFTFNKCLSFEQHHLDVNRFIFR